MELTDNMVSLIAHLRTLFFLSLVSGVRSAQFPLNKQMRELIAQKRRQFEEAITLICDLAQAVDVYSEIAEALDTFLSPDDEGSWDEEGVNLQLQFLASLCPETSDVSGIMFSKMAALKREVETIYRYQLNCLILCILWERLAYYRFFPAANLYPNPTDRFLRLVRLLLALAPTGIEGDAEMLLKTASQSWLEVDRIKKYVSGVQSESADAIGRVVAEVKDMMTAV